MREPLLLGLDQPRLLHVLEQPEDRGVGLPVAAGQVVHQLADRQRPLHPQHPRHRELPLADRRAFRPAIVFPPPVASNVPWGTHCCVSDRWSQGATPFPSFPGIS